MKGLKAGEERKATSAPKFAGVPRLVAQETRLQKGEGRWLGLFNLSPETYLKILPSGQRCSLLNLNSFNPTSIQLLRLKKLLRLSPSLFHTLLYRWAFSPSPNLKEKQHWPDQKCVWILSPHFNLWSSRISKELEQSTDHCLVIPVMLFCTTAQYYTL